MPQLGPGSVLAERYELIEQLGVGGMGSVWKARHLGLDTFVAVKLVREEIAESEESQERFAREAKAAAALQSSHVVRVFDYGVQDGQPYLVMELLAGESLAERLARQGKLSPAQTLEVLLPTLRGIELAHEQGVVHRDLKPENIFISKSDGTKVLDFGIAKITGADHEPRGLTQTGALIGTPHYMSPEQAQGKKDVDARTDLWSLGVIAYECLTGELPFDAEGVGELIVKISTGSPRMSTELANVPSAFVPWFERAVARDPADRFQSARDMSQALRDALQARRTKLEAETALLGSMDTLQASDVDIDVRAASRPGQQGVAHTLSGEEAGRKPTLAIAIAVVVAVLVGAGWWLQRPSDTAIDATVVANPDDAAADETGPDEIGGGVAAQPPAPNVAPGAEPGDPPSAESNATAVAAPTAAAAPTEVGDVPTTTSAAAPTALPTAKAPKTASATSDEPKPTTATPRKSPAPKPAVKKASPKPAATKKQPTPAAKPAPTPKPDPDSLFEDPF
jgi:serine/threonine-protein kinase